MVGLLFPKNGSCTIAGQSVGQRIPALMEKIYYLPEEYELPAIPMRQFIKVNAPFYQKFSFEEFKGYADEFDLDPQKKLSSMSYGQKKKFLMAFGLATHATFMVLDEPTNGLDIPSKSQFRKIMASTINEERCYIISTHQVRDLENLIDPVVVVDKGKIIFNETVDTITSQLFFGEVKMHTDMELLFADGFEGRQKGVMVNPDGRDTILDLEMLFNTIVLEKEKINNLFKK
jgi:ABC-2 type transport system ATP-binding protein